MALVCAQCSRVNPPEAAYCYHDGAALAGRAGGPINPGAAAFPSPFVFPNGQSCRNFDQLAMTCQQNWAAALDLLKQGFLATFFGGLGRVDLAVAAQEAAKFPDPDRGLDQLLGKLPSQVVEAPKLHAEPSEINLGRLKIGDDRTIDLHLRNAGMRLLYGSVASDARWLSFGDAPGQPQKVFQFGEEMVIPVQVRGQHLRAGIRPLEGQLVIDSNGGAVTVSVRAEIPVTPFKGGDFDGAVTPRQIAEKAKAHPKETAAYFEDGRVAAWFQSNGWTYPVQGPPMSGMGAVQQFFEALGVAKPPSVQVKPGAFQFEGMPDKVFEVKLEVTSAEKKVVYGWATSDRPWVAVGKTKLTGRTAVIPLTITLPNRKGTQQANLTVVGNGQQRFIVPVTVAVIGGADILDAEVIEPSAMEAQIVDQPIAALQAPTARAAAAPAAAAPVVAAAPARPPSTPLLNLASPRPPTDPAINISPARPSSNPAVVMEAPAPAVPAPAPAPKKITPMPSPTVPGPAPLVGEESISFETLNAPAATAMADPELSVRGAGVVSRPAGMIGSARTRNRWVHGIPLALLALAVFGTCARDIVYFFFRTPATPFGGSDVDPRELLKLTFDYNFDKKKVDPTLGHSMMTGLLAYDPVAGKKGDAKKLIYHQTGQTNSVMLKIDDDERIFGQTTKGGRYAMTPKNALSDYPGKVCAFEFLPQLIVVTQEVKVVPGEPYEVAPGEYKRLLDTVLFSYKIKNEDNKPHDVSLRFLLDTYIGTNDGVPFTLPGQTGLIDDSIELTGDKVPDFFQVLEKSELRDHGLVAQIGLRLGKFEVPGRVLLTAHPEKKRNERRDKDIWDVPLEPIKAVQDSCVVMYWEPAQLGAGQYREVAFTYGLGHVSIGPAARVGLTVGGAMLVGSDLTVVALIADPQPDQKVELVLPPGLTLAPGSTATQLVQPSTEKNKEGKPLPSPVTWRVRAATEGSFNIVVETRFGADPVTQQRRVTIQRAKLF